MRHRFLYIGMSLSKADIKRDVLNCLKGKKVDEIKLALFVDGLIREAEGILEAYKDSNQPETIEDIRDERDYDFEKSKYESMLRKFKGFKEFFQDNKSRFLDESDYFTFPPYLEYLIKKDLVVEVEDGKYVLKEGVQPFPEILDQLEGSLDITIEALGTLVNFWKRKAGRKTDLYRPDYIRNVFVMAECLLDIEIPITRNTTPFNELLYYALSLIDRVSEDSEPNFPRLVKHCFEDYNTVASMAYVYHKYDRLDLFQKHIARTPYERFFLDEWETSFWRNYIENQAIRQ